MDKEPDFLGFETEEDITFFDLEPPKERKRSK